MFHAADRRRMTNAPLCSCPRQILIFVLSLVFLTQIWGAETHSRLVLAHSFRHKNSAVRQKTNCILTFEGGKDELHFLAIVINLVVFSLFFDFCCSRENYSLLHKQHFLKRKEKDMSGVSSRQNPPLEQQFLTIALCSLCVASVSSLFVSKGCTILLNVGHKDLSSRGGKKTRHGIVQYFILC